MKHLLKRQFSDDANIFRSLLTIYGIGFIKASVICVRFAIHKNMTFRDLAKSKLNRLNIHLTKDFITELSLRRPIRTYLQTHKLYGSYKGLRFKQGLPSNGQRTHTNAKSVKRLLRKNRSILNRFSAKSKKKK